MITNSALSPQSIKRKKMKRKKDTADACKKKHVVDVVGKVVLITRGHMELS
jgi:hypothetical protein